MANRHISPALYGIETEHTTLIQYPYESLFTQEDVVDACHTTSVFDTPEPESSPVSTHLEASVSGILGDMRITRRGDFMSNGGSLYFDPSGFETATAECTTAEEAVHRSLDESLLIYKVLGLARQYGYIRSAQVNRRTTDHLGASRGSHLNTTISESFFKNDYEEQSQRFDELMVALNVAKGALFGSGGLLLSRKDGSTSYYHSPRLAITDVVSSVGSSVQKALVRSGAKPDTGVARIENTSADALNFAWPLRASLIMTKAASMLLEADFEGDIPFVNNPIQAAHDVGRYGSLATVWCMDRYGEHIPYNPLDIVRKIAEQALRLSEVDVELPSEMTQVLGEVITVADVMRQDMFAVSGQVESVLRLEKLLRRKEEVESTNPAYKHNKNGAWGSKELCRQDYLWDLVGGGTAEALREKNLVGWLGFKHKHSVSDRTKRMLQPPKDTRAVLRAKFIESCVGSIEDWDTARVYLEDIKMHPLQTKLPDPYNILI